MCILKRDGLQQTRSPSPGEWSSHRPWFRGLGLGVLLVLSVSGEELDHRAADRLLSPRERERAWCF